MVMLPGDEHLGSSRAVDIQYRRLGETPVKYVYDSSLKQRTLSSLRLLVRNGERRILSVRPRFLRPRATKVGQLT